MLQLSWNMPFYAFNYCSAILTDLILKSGVMTQSPQDLVLQLKRIIKGHDRPKQVYYLRTFRSPLTSDSRRAISLSMLILGHLANIREDKFEESWGNRRSSWFNFCFYHRVLIFYARYKKSTRLSMTSQRVLLLCLSQLLVKSCLTLPTWMIYIISSTVALAGM